MKVLDLFSGIGGFSLGLERAGMETIAFCEIDKFCQKVLKKHWPDIMLHDDITKLDGKEYAGAVDLVCGGYPCQPFSVAGKQKGNKDARHLWPEMFRIIKDAKPRWVIAENVEGHIKLGLDAVLDDLESEGYACWTFIIPACAVGAPHQRNRVWIIANLKSEQSRRLCGQQLQPDIAPDSISDAQYDGQSAATELRGDEKASNNWRAQEQNEAREFKGTIKSSYVPSLQRSNEGGKWRDASNCERERTQRQQQESLQGFKEFSWCEGIRSVEDLRGRQDIPEPLICRGDDGIPNRSHRIKALGNAVVPQIPEIIGRAIMELEAA